MSKTINGLKLVSNKPVVGFGICLGSVRIAEMAAMTGFDFIMIDLLHSHFSKESATNAIRAIARSGGAVPFGRVSNNDPGSINDLLDAGALGIIVPMVESAEEAVKAIESIYYPPLGKRSKGSPAAVFYGSEYYMEINENLNALVMIETTSAAVKADEILSVPGVTGCLIGAGDLQFEMKMYGRDSEFKSVVYKIVESAKKNNIAVGISVGSPEDLKTWWKSGLDFFLTSHDMGIFNTAIRKYDEKFTRLKVSERI